MGGEGDRERAVFGSGVGVGDSRAGANERAQPIRPVPAAHAKERGAHRRTVTGGEDAAARRRDAQEHLQRGAKCRPAHAGREKKKPVSYLAAERPGKEVGITSRRKKRLSDERGVLGVVRNHAAPEEKAMPRYRAEETTLSVP